VSIFLRFDSLEARFDVGIAGEAEAPGDVVSSGAGSSVVASMPGVLAEIKVAQGATVAFGEIVAVVESMKLFIDLRSPVAGRVASIVAAHGQTLAAGDLVMAIEPVAAPDDSPSIAP
jgi:3-methylcrotonyl-CoA carboxylase alpha subunit